MNIGPNLTRKLLDSVPPPSPRPETPQDDNSSADQSKTSDSTLKKETSETKTEETGEITTEAEGKSSLPRSFTLIGETNCLISRI